MNVFKSHDAVKHQHARQGKGRSGQEQSQSRPLPMPEPINPWSMGTSVRVAKYMKAPMMAARKFEARNCRPLPGSPTRSESSLHFGRPKSAPATRTRPAEAEEFAWQSPTSRQTTRPFPFAGTGDNRQTDGSDSKGQNGFVRKKGGEKDGRNRHQRSSTRQA